MIFVLTVVLNHVNDFWVNNRLSALTISCISRSTKLRWWVCVTSEPASLTILCSSEPVFVETFVSQQLVSLTILCSNKPVFANEFALPANQFCWWFCVPTNQFSLMSLRHQRISFADDSVFQLTNFR
jgi:hypothetical protein